MKTCVLLIVAGWLCMALTYAQETSDEELATARRDLQNQRPTNPVSSSEPRRRRKKPRRSRQRVATTEAAPPATTTTPTEISQDEYNQRVRSFASAIKDTDTFLRFLKLEESRHLRDYIRGRDFNFTNRTVATRSQFTKDHSHSREKKRYRTSSRVYLTLPSAMSGEAQTADETRRPMMKLSEATPQPEEMPLMRFNTEASKPSFRENTGKEPSFREDTKKEKSFREDKMKEPSSREDKRKEQSSREDKRKEPSFREDPRKEKSFREDTRKQSSSMENKRKEPSTREDARKEPSYREEPRIEQSFREDTRKEAPTREDPRKEKSFRVDPQKEPSFREDQRKEPSRFFEPPPPPQTTSDLRYDNDAAILSSREEIGRKFSKLFDTTSQPVRESSLRINNEITQPSPREETRRPTSRMFETTSPPDQVSTIRFHNEVTKPASRDETGRTTIFHFATTSLPEQDSVSTFSANVTKPSIRLSPPEYSESSTTTTTSSQQSRTTTMSTTHSNFDFDDDNHIHVKVPNRGLLPPLDEFPTDDQVSRSVTPKVFSTSLNETESIERRAPLPVSKKHRRPKARVPDRYVKKSNDDYGELRLTVAETAYYKKRMLKTLPMIATYDSQQVIPGVAGRDYTVYSAPPDSQFACARGHMGYVADVAAGCQAFYICTGDGRGEPMLCPNGTLFNQEVLVCDWWYNVVCH